MSLVLHLGVVDVPYSDNEERADKPVRKGKRRGKNKGSRWRRSDLIGGSVTTTGDVAQILEDKYHIMEVFYQEHQAEIARALANGFTKSLEVVLTGGPMPENPLAGGEGAIEASFRKFLDTREMEALGYPGVPTEAVRRGVNHRMKHPYAKRASRPSFVDTGLYQASQKTWVTSE